MASRDVSDSKPHYQLKPEVLAHFESKGRRWLTRRALQAFFRGSKGYKQSLERSYSLLRRGKPVDPLVARAFVEFMQEEMGEADATLETLFEPAAPVEDEGVWISTPSILDAFIGNLLGTEKLSMSNPLEDTTIASRMILATFGYKGAAPGEPLDEPSCIRRGEAAMGWTVARFAEWLAVISAPRALHRTVMFITVRDKRVGASVVLPTREEAFHRLMSGELNWMDLTPDDLESSSRFVFLHSLSDSNHVRGLKPVAKTTAQARTLFLQMAYFTRDVRPLRPAWGTIVTNPQYRDRLRRFGFVETGAVMAGHGLPTTVIRHPRDLPQTSGKARTNYKVLRLIVELFQAVHIRRWRREDRLLARLSQRGD